MAQQSPTVADDPTTKPMRDVLVWTALFDVVGAALLTILTVTIYLFVVIITMLASFFAFYLDDPVEAPTLGEFVDELATGVGATFAVSGVVLLLLRRNTAAAWSERAQAAVASVPAVLVGALVILFLTGFLPTA